MKRNARGQSWALADNLSFHYSPFLILNIMNNIWTVYYSKNDNFEEAIHFENEEDAMRFRNEALDNGYVAYYLRESVYKNYASWMTKHLAE